MVEASLNLHFTGMRIEHAFPLLSDVNASSYQRIMLVALLGLAGVVNVCTLSYCVHYNPFVRLLHLQGACLSACEFSLALESSVVDSKIALWNAVHEYVFRKLVYSSVKSPEFSAS